MTKINCPLEACIFSNGGICTQEEVAFLFVSENNLIDCISFMWPGKRREGEKDESDNKGTPGTDQTS